MKKVLVILLFCFANQFTNAQIQMSSRQLVNTEFNTSLLREEFDTSSIDWPTISNFNNLFMVQNGTYYMNRKVKGEPYAILSSTKVNANAFQLNVRINPIEIGLDGYVGVLFMLQESSIGGYIFEIGPFSKYRLRQVNNGLYINITGSGKSNGWVTAEGFINYNQNNTITIACENRNYDIKVNENRVISFNDIEYKTGSFGIIIGAETKVAIDNIVLMGVENRSINIDNSNSSEVIKDTNAELLNLKAVIEKLQNDNDELLLVVETMKAKGYSSPDDFEAKYVSAIATNNALKLKYDSLVNEYILVKGEYDTLRANQVIPNTNDASFDTLMLELDELKQTNQALEKENAVLSRRVRKLTSGSSKK